MNKKTFAAECAETAKLVFSIFLAGFFMGIFSSCGISRTPISRSAQTTPDLGTWQNDMQEVRLRKAGCYEAQFPGMAWQEIPCTAAPDYPQRPADRSYKSSVGNGNGYAAEVGGSISSASGSFDSVNGITSETGTKFGPGCSDPLTGVSNTFTLQINTNVFDTPTSGCNQRKGCKGWQQFVFSSSGKVYLLYWLIDYGMPCPEGYTADGDDCYMGGSAASLPAQAIGNLAQLGLTASSTGRMNTVILSIMNSSNPVPGQLIAVGQEDILGLKGSWNSAEFNVFGDGCTSQAEFNAGTSLEVRLQLSGIHTSFVDCLPTGYTEETNNLDLRSCNSISEVGIGNGIVFREDNISAGMNGDLQP